MRHPTIQPVTFTPAAVRSAGIRFAIPILIAVLASACASRGGPSARQIISAGPAPAAPYSPAVRAGDLVFFSGQIGMRRGNLAGNVAEETQHALDNLRTLMNEAGIRTRDLVKCTVFLADIRDYAAMNEAYGRFFRGDEPPARSAVGVAGLPGGARVEIECIGILPPKS